MSIKTISKLLIYAGIGIIVFALNMETTVSSGYHKVHNIGLLSQQQNMLMIGALAFLSGIIVFAISYKSESSANKIESENKLEDSLRQNTEKVSQLLKSHKDRWLNTDRDNLLGRATVLIYTFMFVAPTFAITLVEANLLVFLIVGIYAFRPVPASKVILELLYLDIVISVIMSIALLFDDTSTLAFYAIFIVLALINFFIIRFLKQSEAKNKHLKIN